MTETSRPLDRLLACLLGGETPLWSLTFPAELHDFLLFKVEKGHSPVFLTAAFQLHFLSAFSFLLSIFSFLHSLQAPLQALIDPSSHFRFGHSASMKTSAAFFLLLSAISTSSAFRTIPEYQQAIGRLSASYVSPNNREQAEAINSTLLADNVVIRGMYHPFTAVQGQTSSDILILPPVDVTESYVGREKGTEYIWGLFANAEKEAKAGRTQLLPFPVNSTLASLVIQPPMVASSTIGTFSWPTINYFLPLQMDSFVRFNDADMKVTSWDVIFRRYAESWEWMLENTPLIKQIAKEDNVKLKKKTDNTFILANHAAKDVCKVHEELCKGSNKQYKNYDDCYEKLMDKEFGQPWDLGHDTLFCSESSYNRIAL